MMSVAAKLILLFILNFISSKRNNKSIKPPI